jgi:hypothetical protein
MTIIEEFSREAAGRFLQSVVFVDDEIYSKPSGQPFEDTSDLPSMKSPFRQKGGEAAPPQAESAGAAEWTPYHPKQMVESFAREGMVCALYEPDEDFTTDRDSLLFKLCDRADIVILDWDLFNEDGRNILPLITNLVDVSQSSVPHHVRLCVIYTTKPDLTRVTNQIYVALGGDQASGLEVEGDSVIVAGATRIVVFGKPNVSGRSDAAKALEVQELQLADRVIGEFAKMNAGLLPSYVLHGMAAVRRNTKRIVDKFSGDMDGPFILHRALTLESEDAFDQLPELLAEEVLAVIQDGQIKPDEMTKLANESAAMLKLEPANLNWQAKQGKQAKASPEFARMFLAGGYAAIKDECTIPKRGPIDSLHEAMGCGTSQSEKKLAALFNIRTRYITDEITPALGFGTVVRYKIKVNAEAGAETETETEEWAYAFCLMPICDGIRLSNKGGQTTAFPFWNLVNGESLPKGRGIMVEAPKGTFLHLVASGRPSDRLWIARYPAGPAGVVGASSDDGVLVFEGERRLEWIAQIKPAHSQRIAHDVGQQLSRIGLVESEWLRLISESKSGG